jgi:hypothetical protein
MNEILATTMLELAKKHNQAVSAVLVRGDWDLYVGHHPYARYVMAPNGHWYKNEVTAGAA